MKALKIDGELCSAGDLDGTMVKVEIDLDDLFEKIDPESLVSEVDERAASGCPTVTAALASWADDYAPAAPERDDEPWFGRFTDWDRDELRKAILLDDGRRAIDLLKRNLTTT